MKTFFIVLVTSWGYEPFSYYMYLNVHWTQTLWKFKPLNEWHIIDADRQNNKHKGERGDNSNNYSNQKTCIINQVFLISNCSKSKIDLHFLWTISSCPIYRYNRSLPFVSRDKSIPSTGPQGVNVNPCPRPGGAHHKPPVTDIIVVNRINISYIYRSISKMT